MKSVTTASPCLASLCLTSPKLCHADHLGLLRKPLAGGHISQDAGQEYIAWLDETTEDMGVRSGKSRRRELFPASCFWAAPTLGEPLRFAPEYSYALFRVVVELTGMALSAFVCRFHGFAYLHRVEEDSQRGFISPPQ